MQRFLNAGPLLFVFCWLTMRVDAQVFVNVTPSASAVASIGADESIYVNGANQPPITVNDAIAMQTTSVAGINQTASLGSVSSVYSNASSTLTSSGNALSLQVQCATGYTYTTVLNTSYNAVATVHPNANDGGSDTAMVEFQVPQTGIYSLGGQGHITANTSQQVQSWSSGGSFTGIMNGEVVYSATDFSGSWQWNSKTASGYTNFAPLVVTLYPGIDYTLSANAGVTTAMNFYPNIYNPNGVSTSVSIQNLSVIPEPASLGAAMLVCLGLVHPRSHHRS